MEQKIEKVLETTVRPMIRSHGGDISFAGYDDGVVRIQLQGACAGCASADLGTRAYVEEMLRKEIPEVRGVKIDRTISSELYDQALEILRKSRKT
ncbi:MAG: NifU family protein [Lachnospiraceae bacterium]|nr:NifU family protein [Lachnospiraceae bacterium]